MNQQLIEKASQIIVDRLGKSNLPDAYCAMSVVDKNGYPHISTITIAKSEGIQKVYLCTGLSSSLIVRLKNQDKASVCLNSGTYSFTLDGIAKVLTDEKIKKDCWYDGLSMHFKDGYKDEHLCVIEFTTKEYGIFIDWTETRGKF